MEKKNLIPDKSISKKGSITIDQNKCKGCELCVKFCPNQLIIIKKTLNSSGFYPAEFSDKDNKCTGCALCAVMCPDVAIEVYK